MEKYYVHGCRSNGDEIERCEDSEAQFWTLYVRDNEGLSHGVIDCAFREDAEAAMAAYVERDRLNEQLQFLRADRDEEERIAISNFLECAKLDAKVRALAAEVQSCRQFVAEHLGPDAEIEFAGLSLERSDAVLREVGALAAELAIDGAIDAMVRSGAQTFGDCVVAVNGIRAGEQP